MKANAVAAAAAAA
ncbi:hypothetical protein M0743_15320, partial [Salmonella enterica subsp. enterica serovar Oranienburg]|nr:hypothetical protein [Salmonella enterica subsp. enterica serovar Oranienburg]